MDVLYHYNITAYLPRNNRKFCFRKTHDCSFSYKINGWWLDGWWSCAKYMSFVVDVPATLKSAAMANSKPPPRAAPSIAAIVGIGKT
jgi:hypothetical protein